MRNFILFLMILTKLVSCETEPTTDTLEGCPTISIAPQLKINVALNGPLDNIHELMIDGKVVPQCSEETELPCLLEASYENQFAGFTLNLDREPTTFDLTVTEGSQQSVRVSLEDLIPVQVDAPKDCTNLNPNIFLTEVSE